MALLSTFVVFSCEGANFLPSDSSSFHSRHFPAQNNDLSLSYNVSAAMMSRI